MDLKSRGRKLSFEILSSNEFFLDGERVSYRSKSVPFALGNGDMVPNSHDEQGKRRRKRRSSRKKMMVEPPILESPLTDNDMESDSSRAGYSEVICGEAGVKSYCHNYSVQSVVTQECSALEETGSCETVDQALGESQGGSSLRSELHIRNVGGNGTVEEKEDQIKDNKTVDEKKLAQSIEVQPFMSNGGVIASLDTAESLDWNRLMAQDPTCLYPVEKSPMKYFLDEMYVGNALHGTTVIGNEKEREQVYDTIFRLPWRCELLIGIGFLVCLDSFLSLLTIMPARLLMAFWRLVSRRKLIWFSSTELCDFGSFVVLVFGVTLLEQTDISLIYHMIRGQGTVKLYVVYNVLEIFDKLFQNFVGDVLQTLFNSAEGLANCCRESRCFWSQRFVSDQALAVAVSIVHSFILLVQAITLSTCIVAHNNALFALLVSNNFAEIKSNVFKRFNKDNIHSLAYFDSVERFHILAFLLFVLAQNILEAEGPWFRSFLFNAFLVFVCEMSIDIIKHSFLAKFNNIKPMAYSEFLEDLCKQTLSIERDDTKKNLTFVPLAPACVVIRVLTPIYGAHLPYGPFLWRLFWMLALFSTTYVMLASLKMMIGMGLRKHAVWYVKRCRNRRHHLHVD